MEPYILSYGLVSASYCIFHYVPVADFVPKYITTDFVSHRVTFKTKYIIMAKFFLLFEKTLTMSLDPFSTKFDIQISTHTCIHREVLATVCTFPNTGGRY